MTESLYVLFDKQAPFLKIGISANVPQRIRQLYRDFDLDRSFLVKPKDIPARKLERILHSIYAIHRRVKTERRSGDTEWFAASIENELVNFLSQNERVFGNIRRFSTKHMNFRCFKKHKVGDKEIQEKEAQNRLLEATLEELIRLLHSAQSNEVEVETGEDGGIKISAIVENPICLVSEQLYFASRRSRGLCINAFVHKRWVSCTVIDSVTYRSNEDLGDNVIKPDEYFIQLVVHPDACFRLLSYDGPTPHVRKIMAKLHYICEGMFEPVPE